MIGLDILSPSNLNLAQILKINGSNLAFFQTNQIQSTEMIRVGVFGESEDLFRQTFVAETTETDASEHNGVFTYFSWD